MASPFGVRSLRSTRLFRTQKDCLGKGAQSLGVGDGIWIFPDTEVPFILRKNTNGTYRLIGQAYVHGIMHGEARVNIASVNKQQLLIMV